MISFINTNRVAMCGIIVFSLIIFSLFVYASFQYIGNIFIYFLFSILSNLLLFMGFRQKAIFFDTFIGAFCWLGFWFKFSVHVAFMGGEFEEPIGQFNGTAEAFDTALLVSSCGLAAFLAAGFIRQNFIFSYPHELKGPDSSMLFLFYKRHRKFLLAIFFIVVLIVGFTNAYLGIYQRGEIPTTVLPYGISGIYKWLLLFGLASGTALLLHFEYNLKKKTGYSITLLGLVEAFISNVSLLSRGMVLNTSALVYGVMCSIGKYKIKSNNRFLLVTFTIFLVMFISSIFIVSYVRHYNIAGYKTDDFQPEILTSNSPSRIPLLFLDRWVGIEGVMAMSSYPEKGWDLWDEAVSEKFSYDSLGFYDTNIITSPYRNTDLTKHHYVSLPGIIAFCFYPGSYTFLFFGILSLGILAGLTELFVYTLGGKNLILCALLSQVIVVRYTHFGYAPSQSYLLFGALFLNVLIIYLFEKYLCYKSKITEKITAI